MTQKLTLILAVLIITTAGIRTVAASIAFRDTAGESSLGNGKLASYFGARLVALSPVNPKAWNAYGKALEVSGQPEPAFGAYQKALQLNPNYVENLVPMAQIRFNQGRFEETVELCRQAESITPNYTSPVWLRAVSLYELKRYADAAKDFEDYLVYDPANFDANLNLGVCYIQLKRKTEAVAAWEKAYALNPNDTQVVRYLKAQGVNFKR